MNFVLNKLTVYGFYFGIPILLIAFFGISLFRFLHAKSVNKKAPDSFSAPEIRKRKHIMIIASVIMAALVAVWIGFNILIYLAVAYM